MNLIKYIMLISILSCTLVACKSSDVDANAFQVTGILQKQGITNYQYGTHILAGYALRSNVIVLDDYVNQNVTIIGRKIEGYPLSGGPEYLEVTHIK